MKRMMLLLLVLSLLSMPVLAQAEDGPGAVYAMTNADEVHGGNEIVVYHRAANGMLTLAGIFATNGNGKTTALFDALGAQNPLILSPDNRWLFAVNAGSNSITVFQVNPDDSLTLTDVVDSGGDFPVSLTIHRKLLYVLNSGGDGNITGFTLDTNGHLMPLAGSTRSLNAGGANPPDFLESPAQVGFTPLGDQLVVTEKGASQDDLPLDPKIHVFAVDGDGLPSAQPVTTANLPVPFGFVFDDLNNLIVAQPFGDQLPGGGRGAAGSYDIAADGSLVSISDPVPNDQTATCWIAITTSTRFAYTTNNGSDTISSYKVNPDGSLSLLNVTAATTGNAPVDLAITPSQYLYNVNSGAGTVSMFKIDPMNGSLISLGEIGGLPETGTAVGIAAH